MSYLVRTILVTRPYGILVDSNRLIKKDFKSSYANVMPYDGHLCDPPL